MATVTVISPVTGKPVEHKRVAAYCRVSTNSADQQNSYNTQVRYYTYTTLMKATIAEAIGFDGSDDEKELLERQVNGLNEKMIAIVNESIASGEDIESREGEIKEIADAIEDLKRRIQIITENSMKNAEYADRIAEIERIITERASHQNEYDDSIVRQMVECIKVYADKHIEVIFGGGYAVEEMVE